MLKIILIWFGLLLLAIINGTIRDFLYLKKLGEHRAHQLSTITLLILMTIYCLIIFSNWSLTSSSEAITYGITWLLLTLAFEFLFGHFVAGKMGKAFKSSLQYFSRKTLDSNYNLDGSYSIYMLRAS